MNTATWHARPLSSRLTALLVVLGIGAVAAGGWLWSELNIADRNTTPLQCQAAQDQARRAVGQQVWADQGSELMSEFHKRDTAALANALAQVDRYFDRAHRGTEQFSKAVLGWDAQWSLVMAKLATVIDRCDRLPTWLKWRWLCTRAKVLAQVMDKQAFRKHVAAQLARHVFSPQGMDQTVRHAVHRYQQRLADQDLALLDAFHVGPPSAAPDSGEVAEAAPRQLETVHTDAAQSALSRSRTGAGSELLRTLVQRVGSKLLVTAAAYALQEGAVELGLMSAGTASSLWSFGVGLAVAALANVALRYVLDRVGKSPRKSIQRRLAAEVAAMRRCVVEGCTRKMGSRTVTIPGLRSRLQSYRDQQQHRRARTLRRLLVTG